MPDLLTAKQLRENRAPVARLIKELADKANGEARDFTAEEQEQWDRINGEYDTLSRSITFAERAEKVIVEQEAPAPQPEGRKLPGREDRRHVPESDTEERDDREDRRRTPKDTSEEDRAYALQAWFRAGLHKDLEARHVEACNRLGVRPHSNEFSFELRRDYHKVKQEHRAQSINFPNLGAYTVPEGFVNSLERAMLDFGGVRQVADVMRTTSGNPMPWPTTNDTSNEGVLINENTAVSDQDVTFGAIVFGAHKYSSKQVKVPVELLEDSAFNLAVEIGSMLGERLGRITNRHFTTGDGAAKPNGIVTAATVGKTTASATAISSDEILDLIHSVDPAYRINAGFMFHDNILLAIRKLKTGTGEYLWQPGLQSGVPDRIAGYAYTINQHMQSSLATATRTMVFGALNKYKVRDVSGVRLVRLNERYADADQVGFLAFSRHDGNLLDAGTNPVKAMLQA